MREGNYIGDHSGGNRCEDVYPPHKFSESTRRSRSFVYLRVGTKHKSFKNTAVSKKQKLLQHRPFIMYVTGAGESHVVLCYDQNKDVFTLADSQAHLQSATATGTLRSFKVASFKAADDKFIICI